MKVKIKFKGKINYKAIKMRCPSANIEFIKHLNGEWTAKVSERFLEQILPILSENADYYKICYETNK